MTMRIYGAIIKIAFFASETANLICIRYFSCWSYLGSVSKGPVSIGAVPRTDRPCVSTGLIGTVPFGTSNRFQLGLLLN